MADDDDDDEQLREQKVAAVCKCPVAAKKAPERALMALQEPLPTDRFAMVVSEGRRKSGAGPRVWGWGKNLVSVLGPRLPRQDSEP